MIISKTDIDNLNAVINISIDKKDYEQKVQSILKDYAYYCIHKAT